MTAEKPYRTRRQRARDLWEYLTGEDYRVVGVEDYRIVWDAPPPSDALDATIRDLQPELVEFIQGEIARLIVSTRFKAWREPYAAEESALTQVRETWPKSAWLAAGIGAKPLYQVALAAANELCEITGDLSAVDAAARIIASRVPWESEQIQELADFVQERWLEQGHGGHAEGGAFDELERALRMPALWALARRVPEQAEPEPASRR